MRRSIQSQVNYDLDFVSSKDLRVIGKKIFQRSECETDLDKNCRSSRHGEVRDNKRHKSRITLLFSRR